MAACAPSSRDFMAELEAARTPPRAGEGAARTPSPDDLEASVFRDLMAREHGDHWTSPAKDADAELFVEVARDCGSSVASDETEAPPTYAPTRPPPGPPRHSEALAPYAALARGSPADVRRRLRAAATTLRRRLDAGLPLRTLVWDRVRAKYAVATLEPGGFWWRWDATARKLRRRNRRRRIEGLATPSPAARAVAFFSKGPPPTASTDSQESRAGRAFLQAVQRRRGVDAAAVSEHRRWRRARRGGGPSAPDDSDSSDDDGTIKICGETAHVQWSTLEGVVGEVQTKGQLPPRFRTFSLILQGDRLDLAVDDCNVRRSLVSGFGAVAAAMRSTEAHRPLDVVFDDVLRKCDGASCIREAIEDDARTRRRDFLDRCGLRRLHALYRDDQHPELHNQITKGTLVHVAHDVCPESGEAPYTVEFPVPRSNGEDQRYVKLRQPCPLFVDGSFVTGEVIGTDVNGYVVLYRSGPHRDTKEGFVEEVRGLFHEEVKESEPMLEKPPSMPEGTLLKGIKRELLEVDVAYQKRDFVPYFTVCALLVYWVKFFVDLSGDDEVAGSLRDALETVAPFDTCTLQTNQFRRLFTYQFVHVNAGHLVANSIILLVLGAPLEMAHGPVVGIAFEAGVILGAMASLVFAPYQRVVGFSAGVYCVLGVHFGHLLFHWADMRRGALNWWTRLGIFFCFFGVDMVLSYAEQVSATIHLAGFVVGVVLSAAVLRDLVERPRAILRRAACGILVVLPVLLALRYEFYVVDPPEPLAWLSGESQTTDCCYVLRKCGVAGELYARFSCRGRDRARLFQGSATALYGGGAALEECAEVDTFLEGYV